MPDVWLPGAYRDPGAMAGYSHGRSAMQLAVAHYTVGADSRSVGRSGYFNFLVHRESSRENGCTQYAEVDALTWHAGNWNPYGPGIEYERMTTGGYNDDDLANAEPLTDNQLAWGRRLTEFLAGWGVPVVLYDGPRYGAGGWSGWVNHHDLDADRYDGLTNAEWAAITSTDHEEETEMPSYAVSALGESETCALFMQNGLTKRYLPNQDALNTVMGTGLCSPNVQYLPKVYVDSIPWDPSDPWRPKELGGTRTMTPAATDYEPAYREGGARDVTPGRGGNGEPEHERRHRDD